MFLNPLLLIAGLGVSLPILAHLLNRHKVKRTPWAAMQFLNRNVRVRSRQLKLRDFLLLALRCLVILLLGLALARPIIEARVGGSSALAALGERRAGVLIALDASFSMQHRDGELTRFEKAKEKIRTIAAGLHPGDPVSLVQLGAEHEVIVRQMAFEADRFAAILNQLEPTSDVLNLDSVPTQLKRLVDKMEAPSKEVYIVSDIQAHDWQDRPSWLKDDMLSLCESATICLVPVRGASDNLAITDFRLVSGVLRKGTVARYSATVRNYGPEPALNVPVKGLVDGLTVSQKMIQAIAPDASETVSLFVRFSEPGPVRIAAEVSDSSLQVDNARRAVAVIRDKVSILCVQGSARKSTLSSGDFISAALQARGSDAAQENLSVHTVSWLDFPVKTREELDAYDIVILDNVPRVTEKQADDLRSFVQSGRGLIWFAGDDIDAKAWNEVSQDKAGAGRLLPAIIEDVIRTSDATGVGSPMNPELPDHPICRPLRALPEDLLGETRFRKMLQVKPHAGSYEVLSLADATTPLLIEQMSGRGHVFMFTTSSDSSWHNMPVTPVFPMVLQQMVTYMTSREFETPRLVGESLALTYEDEPDASEAVFDAPSTQSHSVPVRVHRNQYVALLDHARESGFYLARVSLQAPGMPVAVNVDTKESNLHSASDTELQKLFQQTPIVIARSDDELLDLLDQSRTSRSLWLFCLIMGLGFMVLETLLSDRMFKPGSQSRQAGDSEVAS